MTIQKFRKKPVVIEAVQYLGYQNVLDVLGFTGRHFKFIDWFESDEAYVAHVRRDRNVLKVFTLEGVMEASPGDWIIKGVNGEFYPCKPDIFEKTYEPETAAPQPVVEPVERGLRHPEYAHGITDAELVKEALAFCDEELDPYDGMEFDDDSEVCCQRSNTFIRELTRRLAAAAPQLVAAIVPEHCPAYAFVFEGGCLTVSKDGSGYIVVDEGDFYLEDDRCEGPDGPEGSVHWIARFPAGEMTALRDFLNGQRFTAPTAEIDRLKVENERLKAGLERETMRLAACGVIAFSNTPETAHRERQMHDDYWSASAGDVANAVDREMSWRDRATAAEARIAELEASEKRMREALKPFVTDWADETGWTKFACQKDRIVDWFGPSDFRRARTALAKEGE